ncbi:MAG TPA: hypothetical protein PLU48_02835, partial [Candidatus Woesebacteria bacterium]|nr:hypothetical protein [Candidatus Woesebacteria bacterium]
PVTQWLLQHWLLIEQVTPLLLQEGFFVGVGEGFFVGVGLAAVAEHLPATQWLLQHWLLIEQVIPLALQEGLTVGVAVGLGIQHLIPGDAQLL